MKISLKKYAEALVASLANEKDPKRVGEKIMNLLKLLNKRKQTKLIKGLPEIFKKLWFQKQGKAEIIVTVPFETPTEELDELSKLIGNALDKKVFITTKLDKEIIGGMKLEFDDYVVDATITRALKGLKQKFSLIS